MTTRWSVPVPVLTVTGVTVVCSYVLYRRGGPAGGPDEPVIPPEQ